MEFVDVYRVLTLFNVTDPCIQHAIKKLLVAGGRGAGKDVSRDIQESIDSLVRWQEMRAEDSEEHLVKTDAPKVAPPPCADCGFFYVNRCRAPEQHKDFSCHVPVAVAKDLPAGSVVIKDVRTQTPLYRVIFMVDGSSMGMDCPDDSDANYVKTSGASLFKLTCSQRLWMLTSAGWHQITSWSTVLLAKDGSSKFMTTHPTEGVVL